jgi:CubicO group peptidase (beta-lactamase class C family)
LLGILAGGVMLAGGAEGLTARPRRRQACQATAPADVANLIQAYMQQTGTPGAALVSYDNGTEHASYFGDARSDRPGPPTADTVFGIGSVTKTFSCTLLASQVLTQPGSFSLDDPVVKHLPWLAGKPLGDIQQVTLKMLATHTSGFPREGPQGGSLFQDKPPTDELIQWWADWKLPPNQPAIGTKYAYSNIGMITLGYAVAGTGYDPLLKSAITVPLGMTSTAAADFLPQNAPLAQGHVEKDNKTVAVDQLNTDLNSTPADMQRYIQAQVGALAGGTPLGQAIELTHTVQFPAATKNFDLGLAWQIFHSTPVVLTKDGATSEGGCSCWIAVVPSTRQGVMVLTNKFRAASASGPSIGSLGGSLLTALTGIHLASSEQDNG